MENTFEKMREKIKEDTLKNRDEAIEIYKEYSDKTLVLLLIETMKKYAQATDDDGLTPIYMPGQYIMVLDAIQTILTKRGFLKRVKTWTLEDFLNDVPFSSEIVEED